MTRTQYFRPLAIVVVAVVVTVGITWPVVSSLTSGAQSSATSDASSTQMLGEIRLFSGNFEPPGWKFADGRLLPISENTALFEILGNTYGGDGRTTFGLPDLRGRVPMGKGAGVGLTNRSIGQEVGAEAVTLDVSQLPSHDHTLRATNSSATQTQPASNILATASTPQYLNASTSVVMGTDAIGSSGSDAPHPNVQPSTVLSFIIAVAGRSPKLDFVQKLEKAR